MSNGPEDLIKPPIGSGYAQSGISRTPSTIRNTAKTENQTNLINAMKWASVMKQNLLEATNTSKSNTVVAQTLNTSRNALEAQQIQAEIDYKKALNQLSFQLEGKENTVVDGDVSGQNTCDANLKQQQLALYKKHMYARADGNLNNLQSVGNVDSWVSQAIMQTAVGDDWAPALKWIINMESSGNPNAQNPNSTAYGLMQFMDNTWGNCGFAKTADPIKQVAAGINYIKQRYGTADNAKDFWQKNQWY